MLQAVEHCNTHVASGRVLQVGYTVGSKTLPMFFCFDLVLLYLCNHWGWELHILYLGTSISDLSYCVISLHNIPFWLSSELINLFSPLEGFWHFHPTITYLCLMQSNKYKHWSCDYAGLSVGTNTDFPQSLQPPIISFLTMRSLSTV